MKIKGKYGEYEVEVYRNVISVKGAPFPVALVILTAEGFAHHYWHEGPGATRSDSCLIDDAIYKVDCHGEAPIEGEKSKFNYFDVSDGNLVTLEGSCGSLISIDPECVTEIKPSSLRRTVIVRVTDLENKNLYNDFNIEGEVYDVCRKVYGGSEND